MAFLLDSDLPNVQLLSYHSHQAKHCRLCCNTAVCEDIWKKFAFEEVEVLPTPLAYPTPPLSPRLSPEPASDSEEEPCLLEQIMRLEEYDDDDDKDDRQQLDELENYLRSKLIQVRLSVIYSYNNVNRWACCD